MRLWHQDLIEKLPRQQLLGQHRECCALRGKGWDKKHSTVQYALDDHIEKLVAYHWLVMNEMVDRGYNPNDKWQDPQYRGKKLGYDENVSCQYVNAIYLHNGKIYDYHENNYMRECLNNLKSKGVKI